VTECGIADLLGKNLRERTAALVSLARPGHREALAAATGRFGTCGRFVPRAFADGREETRYLGP